MKHITLLITLLLTTVSIAQQSGEVVIFDNSGYQFHVILNGIMQNNAAESNVRIEGLAPSFYNCKILASDNTFSIDKNIIAKSDTLITYRIVNKRGKFKLRYFSEVPLNAAPTPPTSQILIAYHTTEYTTSSNGVAPTTNTVHTSHTSSTNEPVETPSTSSMDMNMTVHETPGTHSETIHTETTITETRDGVHSNTETGVGEGSFSVSMNVDENGANVHVQGTGFDDTSGATMHTEMESSESVTYTEQTTTTTTVTTTSGNWTTEEENLETADNLSTIDVNDCFIGEVDFDMFLKEMSNTTFEDDKTEKIRRFVTTKCLNLEQIGALLDQFTFEDNRLTIAKAAYDLCYESSDYLQLLEKFTFDSDQEELRDYVMNR